MSRRKKRVSEDYLTSTWSTVRDPSSTETPSRPRPPKPNKAFLLTSIILLTAWVVFLLIMALLT